MQTSEKDLLTIGAAYNESDALIQAIHSAKDFCDDRNQVAIFEETIRKSQAGSDSSLRPEEFSLFTLQEIKPAVILKFQCNQKS